MKLPPSVRLLGFALLLLVIPATLSSPSAAQIGIGIGISVRIGPPALPVYQQPICPGLGYLWTPGYWAWSDDDGYYWVPGTWVEAPEPGLLWTPGYWGWNDGAYAWNGGYWGSQIGFYGGINYGFGYGGNGFYGGEWRGGTFFYNTAVMNVNTTVIRNVYVNRTVIVNSSSHVAFNGGRGGVAARPTPEQESYAHERHTPPVAAQTQARACRQPEPMPCLPPRITAVRRVAATAKPGWIQWTRCSRCPSRRRALSRSCYVSQRSARLSACGKSSRGEPAGEGKHGSGECASCPRKPYGQTRHTRREPPSLERIEG